MNSQEDMPARHGVVAQRARGIIPGCINKIIKWKERRFYLCFYCWLDGLWSAVHAPPPVL